MLGNGPRSRRRIVILSSTAGLIALVGLLLLSAGEADAQVEANRLFNDECLVEGVDTFDDVILTGVATHERGTGDVYQAICDTDPDGDCWAFSMNRGSQTTVLTVGLPSGRYDWFVCAWNGSVRDVVANLSGGAVLFTGPVAESGASTRIVGLDHSRVPRDLRRLVRKLHRRP